ncbi:hypothetical protein [Ectopseudomonas mendocina]|uniref:Uncharacterized protein n=1 Tax=Ectopseudomonas mendocina TaxID=300 RepID=A0A2R3QPR9_ECTME|nr:hypothetical protein [Pseudomonas mendocina]AVO53791.1 hypothetical protein C7A17_13755 [Pseudomonas mendocina]
MSMPAPTPFVFCTNPIEGDMPFQAWPDLSLEIDGQPEHSENLLNLAGFLVRQALADQHPERVRHAADVEPLLYGLRAHVQLHSGGCFNFGEEHPDPDQPLHEHQIIPGIYIGNLLLLADGPASAGVEALHARLKPVDAMAKALKQLQESDISQPVRHTCALLPGMTITLTPAFADSRTLVYPSRLDTYQEQLKLEELAGLPQQHCEIVLGGQPLDESQPAYPVTYDILSAMLRALRQRALESGQPDLSARQQEWQHVRLVVGSDVHYSAQYMLNPETYLPAFGKPVRGVKLVGQQSILLPEHLELPALEQLWEALAHEEMREEWQRVQGSDDDADRSLMINLEVTCKLEVLAIGAGQQPQVLESYRDSELIQAPVEQKALKIEPAGSFAPSREPERATDIGQLANTAVTNVEQRIDRASGDDAAAGMSSGRGALLLAVVMVAVMAAVLLKG